MREEGAFKGCGHQRGQVYSQLSGIGRVTVGESLQSSVGKIHHRIPKYHEGKRGNAEGPFSRGASVEWQDLQAGPRELAGLDFRFPGNLPREARRNEDRALALSLPGARGAEVVGVGEDNSMDATTIQPIIHS